MKTRLRILLRPASLLSILLLAGAVVGALLAQRHTEVDLFAEEGIEFISDRVGSIGMVVYVLVLALTIVVSQLPGVPLAIGAGALWGTFPAFGLTVAGSLLGSIAAYCIGRFFGRSAVHALSGKSFSLNPHVSSRSITVAILISRLLPVMPFDIISYAAGISAVRFKGYVAATTVGIIPSVILLSYLGDRMLISPVSSLALSVAAAVVLILIPIYLKKSSGTRLRDLLVWDDSL